MENLNHKYCIKVVYTGDDEVLVGEPLVGFFHDRPGLLLDNLYRDNFVYPNYKLMFPVPYQFPTFYESKWDVITQAFKLQAVLDRTSKTTSSVRKHEKGIHNVEFFCKGWEWDDNEFIKIQARNDDFRRGHDLRRSQKIMAQFGNKKTAEDW